MTAFRYPEDLPISARSAEIIEHLRAHSVVIVAGETGSGKTTQLPKMCIEAGWGSRGIIGCTQPRRVAALSISRRVAQEMNVPWGQEVGCKIRFQDQTSARTVVKFMTDGILLAEIQSDPWLRRYSGLIIDEAHERSLNVDFLLGHLRQLRRRRPDFKTVITSATIDTEAFSQAFDNAPILSVSGRTWPVEIRYAPLEPQDADGEESPFAEESGVLSACVRAAEQCFLESSDGDLLVFLPTENHIRETREYMLQALGTYADVLCLYGRMAANDQAQVFSPGPKRRVILATNLAETSLTLPRIRYVIDSGLARVSRYNPRTRTKRLPIEEVSQSSANQRAGRAGRLQAGIAIRLYSEENFLKRPLFTQPEIQRANLAEVILRMKAFGLGNIEEFPFLNAPTTAAIRAGYRQLHELGALTETLDLTPVGRRMAKIPVDPTLARMLLEAEKERVLEAVLPIAAVLSIPDPRERPEAKRQEADSAHRVFAHPESDFLTLLHIWNASPLAEPECGNNALRRFCKTHFFSFSKMREWREVTQQLREAIRGEISAPDSALRSKVAAPPSSPKAARRQHSMTAPTPEASPDIAGDNRPSKSATPPHPSQTSASPVSLPPPRNPPSDSRELPSPRAPGNSSPKGHSARGPHPLKPARNFIPEPSRSLRSPESSPAHPSKAPGPRPSNDRIEDPALLQSIHRSLLSGLLSQVALHCGPNQYRAPGNRLFNVFPGSSLHKKTGSKRQPRWIMAAELVETSQLFGRTLALIDPRWILQLGTHLIHSSYSEPAWNAEAGRVLVLEKFLLQGLEIFRKHTDYGKVDPEHATELFIRGALLPEDAHIPLRSFQLNRETRQRVEESLTRIRHSHTHHLEDRLYLFYAARIQKVASLPDLFSLFQKKIPTDPDFCVLKESDLIGDLDLSFDRSLFPENVLLENTVLPVSYAYSPGEDSDGVTLRVPLPALEKLSEAQIQWAIPGLRTAQIQALLESLPRTLRRQLSPLEPKVSEIVNSFTPDFNAAFLEAFARFLNRKYSVPVSVSDWHLENLPRHLFPRIQVVDSKNRPVTASRDWKTLEQSVDAYDYRSPAWIEAERKWQRDDLSAWSLGNLPQSIFIESVAGTPMEAHPGLMVADNKVHLRLFRKKSDCQAQTRAGIRLLIKKTLEREFSATVEAMAVSRDMALKKKHAQAALGKSLSELALPSVKSGVTSSVFGANAAQMLFDASFVWDSSTPLEEKQFIQFKEKGTRLLQSFLPRAKKTAHDIFVLHEVLRTENKSYPGIQEDLKRLLPADFPTGVPFDKFEHIPRYLRAIQIRAERASLRPHQDAQKALSVGIFSEWEKKVPDQNKPSFRWLLEEYRVSLFAQELGTAETVSVQRLKQLGNFG